MKMLINPDKKKLHWTGYLMGLLHAVEFCQKYYNEGAGRDILDELLADVPTTELKKICNEQDITINWKDSEVHKQSKALSPEAEEKEDDLH